MPRDVFYPGHKFPAQVQQAGLRQAQLELLARFDPAPGRFIAAVCWFKLPLNLLP